MHGAGRTSCAAVSVHLAASTQVEDRDGERSGDAVVAEQENVAVQKFVGACELVPTVREAHGTALGVAQDLHVPRRHPLTG